MSEIPKAYEPQSVESRWYQFWLEKRMFVADPASPKPPYSIVIPPPNVTGMLHMGHVLNNTIQDILARKARMEGHEVLWLPGTDHAGIATQVQVERALKKEEKKTKYDLGREEFLKRVWAWKEKHGGIIIEQLKRLGASCDWSRERFTMDPEYSRCVQKVFVDLYKKGLIYRGKRMVNWCPATQTALSDEEVIMKEQKGFLYYFRVQVAEKIQPSGRSRGNEAQPSPAKPASDLDQSLLTSAPTTEKKNDFGPVTDADGRTWLTIATTRPETIPGDTAVAVNPKDPRYAGLIGKHVLRALPPEQSREERTIPIVGDESVDFGFGTGVLKVTPAHDKTDFEIGQRHQLPIIEAINADGTMSDAAGVDMKGLDRFKARKVAVEKLKELAALEKEEPYTNNVGFSERADVQIEPRLSEQWFLKYPAVPESTKCVAEGRLKFYPDRWTKVYDHWMTNIQDWCISRQLWWGHRIPVWKAETRLENGYIQNEAGAGLACVLQRENRNSTVALSKEDGSPMHVELWREDNAPPQEFLNYVGPLTICVLLEAPDPSLERQLNDCGFTQDPDVLDTWFSSWLWPFATMGWPQQTETLKKFYPTTALVTGPDIIFFWVARMIMAGYEYMGDLPFRNVYFTGIIRDKQGRKMSKTLGNSPDPLELIGKYGADALRFGVMRSAPLGQDVLFDEKDVELGRNFCNKLWNACRFRQMVGSADIPIQGEIDRTKLTGDDKWILLKLDIAIRELTQSLAEYRFSEAAQVLYRFFWSEYCDWYLEATKAVLMSRRRGDETETSSDESQRLLTSSPTNEEDPRRANTIAVIDFVLSHTLRLFHPFLPFITEELWHGMGYHEDMPETQGGQSIMFAPWPKPLDQDFRGQYGLDDCYLEMADKKYELVTLGRNLRRESNVASNKKVRFIFKPAGHVSAHDAAVLKILLNADPLDVLPDYDPPKGTPAVHSELGFLYLAKEALGDPAIEKARLLKELEKINAEILKVEQKLANPAFTGKVPPAVLLEHQKRLADWQAKKQHIQAALDSLEG